MLESEHPLRLGGLQFALCAAEEGFETAEWLEGRRKQDSESHRNSAEARRSMAHHHCSIALEFAFKVLCFFDEASRDEGGSFKRTGHCLNDALGKMLVYGDELRSLYKEHCEGKVQPIAIGVGRHPECVKGASLDELEGFCEYVDKLARWASARYDHWQRTDAWMYRVSDLAPVLAFGRAAVSMGNRLQDGPVGLRLVKAGDEITVEPEWTQVPVTQERRAIRPIQITLMPRRSPGG